MADLVKALQAAQAAALEHRRSEDGGSRNLDAAVFWPERGMTTVSIERAAKEAGVTISILKWPERRRCVFVYVGEGQANRRSRMAEAAWRVLKDAGLDAGMYYQMD